MPKPRIFISYARSSRASVEQIAVLKPALAEAGFDSLQDVQIALGEDWEPKLKEWLADCHGAVVFVSSEALSSEWVAREVAILMDRRHAEGSERMRIVPIAVGGLDWADLRKASADHPFASLAAIQGGTDLSPDQVLAALQGLHDFVGLPVGLDRGHTSAPPTVLNVLRASQETVPFRHREREMDALGQWIEGGQRNSVWLVHGPGGIGKTRLALELIRRQNEEGWDAGFLRKDAVEVSALVRGADPLLVAVDYAETRTRQLRDLLRSVAMDAKSDTRPRIRVLLLARNGGDWWPHLATEDGQVELLVDQSPRPLRLEPLASSVYTSSFQEAVECFASALERPVPKSQHLHLSDDLSLLGSPLYIQMAALDHVLGATGSPAIRSLAELLDRILSHESRYWRDWLHDRGHRVDEDTHEMMDRTAATVVLLGGAGTPKEVRKIVEGKDGQHEWRRECWTMLRHLYPDGRGGVRPLEPDLLGEHAVDCVLRKTEGDILDLIMDGPDVQSTASSSLIVLTRLAARTHDSRWLRHVLEGRLSPLARQAVTVASSQGEPLGETLALLFDEASDETLTDRFHELLPPPGRTRVLRRLAVSVARRRRQQAPSDDSAQAKSARAEAAEELALRLAEIDEVEEARSANWEATLLLGELMNQEGEIYGAPLASALGVQADLLSRAGQFDKAIESGRSSILLTELLKAEYQQGVEPLLGARYNNLANAYASLGQHAAAAEAAKQAVEYYRHLALEGRFQGECAQAFGNLGRHLVNAGDIASGVTFLRVATTWLRALAAKDPEGFESRLAMNLDQLGLALRDQGMISEAIDALREAVDVLRAVRRRDPTADAIQLAVSLTDLGALVAKTSGDREAVELGRESTALLSKVAEEGNPTARAELARALHELGRWRGSE